MTESKVSTVFIEKYQAEPRNRIEMIRKGLPTSDLNMTIAEMGVSKDKVLTWLHLPRATVNRRLKANGTLSVEHSERVIRLQMLIGQVETMVSESGGDPAFNAAQWLAEWLGRPIPALNNSRPADFLDTMEGFELISSLLAMMQSGAYA
jgi:putative toxin-antitoxin system antitoxin component (TIGR02293 family)